MGWTQLLQIGVAQLAVGAGGGAVAAIGLFRFFGERWLTERSAKKASEDQHSRQKELEALRDQIHRQFDRVTKLSQREFEVLPEIWMRIVDAFSATENSFMRIQSHVDLKRLPEGEVRTLLDAAGIPQSVQQPIIDATGLEKNQLYGRSLRKIEAGAAREKTVEAIYCLARNGVFLPETLHASLDELVTFVWRAIVDVQLDLDDREAYRDIPLKERPSHNFAKTGKASLAAAEKLVRTRLHSVELVS